MTLYTKQHLINTTRIYEGTIFSVRKDELYRQDTGTVTREVVEHNGGVVIACQPTPNEIILVRQYRYSINEELLELPAGRVEIGEDRLLAAQRELIEETGFQAQDWHTLSHMYSAPGFCTELLSFYHASILTWVGKNLDLDEETEVVTIKLSQAWHWAKEGKIKDAKTIAALGFLMHI